MPTPKPGSKEPSSMARQLTSGANGPCSRTDTGPIREMREVTQEELNSTGVAASLRGEKFFNTRV